MATIRQISRALCEKIFPYSIRWGIEEVPEGPLVLRLSKSPEKIRHHGVRVRAGAAEANGKPARFSRSSTVEH